MRGSSRAKKYVSVLLGAAFLITGGLFYWWFTPGRTPQITAVHSIASLERIRIGGVDQYVLIRGDDTSLPVLLFLHGGPGMPAMYLGHEFQKPLEKEFVVVQWDRRGAGKSYRKDMSQTLTSEQLVADTIELTNLLRARFHQDKIYLVGHSWGTHLGMLVIARTPELYRAYVGIGQLARSGDQVSEIQDNYIRQCARRDGDQEAIKELDQKGADVREALLFRFGGEIHRAKSYFPLLMAGLTAPEYSLRDVFNVQKGVALYSKYFVYNSISGDLMDVIPQVEIPVYLFTGRYDYTDPFSLTEDYYSKITAPKKRLVWFEDSAHFPFFEEPTKFAREMDTIRKSL
jgi:pimeloyl-ACP methyl ester carboxylesterase